MTYDVIIIGGGPAGMTAALYLGRAGKTVCLIEGNALGGQLSTSPCIENYPGFMGTGYELAMSIYDQVMTYPQITFQYDTVEGVNQLSDGSFSCKGEDDFYYGKYIIYAAGVSHKTLPCIKGEIEHVHYCATCDGLLYKDKNVVVTGDGNTALQYALELSNYCKQVEIVTMFNQFFGEPILIEKLLKTPNIKWIQCVTIENIENTPNGLALTFSNGVSHLTDGLFIAIGQQPKLIDLPEDIVLNKKYIMVDKNQQTHLENFYAVGDCVDKEYRQVAIAVGEGTIAALNIINKELANGRE